MQKGNPVPKARIFFQRWRGHFAYFEFDHVNQYADREWNLGVERSTAGRIQSRYLPPRRNGVVSTTADRPRGGVCLSTCPILSSCRARSIDAVTKKPIKTFRVVPGVRSGETDMNWKPEVKPFRPLTASITIRRDVARIFDASVRIEADGYQAAVSRDIKSTRGRSRSISS